MLFVVDNFNLLAFSEIISVFLIDNFNLSTFSEIISIFSGNIETREFTL